MDAQKDYHKCEMSPRPSNTSPRRKFKGHAPRVLLLFPTANLVHRRMLNGILRYAQRHGPWEFHVITDIPGEQGLRRTREWGCSGIITYVQTQKSADVSIAAKVPTVFFVPSRTFMEPANPVARFSAVLLDHEAIGALAAEYFLNLRFTRFAFVGHVLDDTPWSINRKRGFTRRLSEHGYTCLCYPRTTARERNDFGIEQRRLCAWLRLLPKPIALMAASDRRAMQILDTCMDAGLSVPHEVAVLGVDNDEVLCETASPSLTSIDIGEENAGYEAARTLDNLMRVKTRGHPVVILHGPKQVVPRRSTETNHIPDPLIAKALDFIQTNIGLSANVSDVARQLNVSRRLLEMRAKQALGGTVRDEILRVRLDRARALLRNTRMTVGEVSAACGFSGTSHLGLRFREAYHITPTAFRASFRSAGDGEKP
jgi:LacI family transcriptional regulator